MLEKKNCVPCKMGDAALAPLVIKSFLGKVPGWALADKEKAIFRKWVLADFDTAFALASQIAAVAKEQNHHPDVNFGWGFVKCRISTHAVGGLTENDFIVAAKINAL